MQQRGEDQINKRATSYSRNLSIKISQNKSTARARLKSIHKTESATKKRIIDDADDMYGINEQRLKELINEHNQLSASI